MVSRPDGDVPQITKGAHPCDPNVLHLILPMKKVNSPSNIEKAITVNREDVLEAERIENDPDAMLRLIDVLFFLRDDDAPPS